MDETVQEGHEPPSTRIHEFAVDALRELAQQEHRLVAFVGSGLSMNYGGLSWAEAVSQILECTDDEIEEALNSNVPSPSIAQALKSRLERTRSLLKAFSRIGLDNGEFNQADYKVALKLADEALGLISYGDPQSRKTVNWFFAELLDENSRLRLRIRVQSLVEPNPDKRRAKETTEHVDKVLDALSKVPKSYLSSFLYNVSWLSKQVSRLKPHLHKLFPKEKGVLRIDQHPFVDSLMLGLLPEEREKLLKSLIYQISNPGIALNVELIPARPLLDPISKLVKTFEIRRLLTTNYDWELERFLVFPELCEVHGRAFESLDAFLPVNNAFELESNAKPKVRRLPDGRVGRSEIYHPDTVAGIYEFALNSKEQDAHVVHLHGRLDDPNNMVSSDDDYNRFYRQESSNPRNLELALDVALTGNPILFVGLGLEEVEITRAFQMLVANGRVSPDSPAFALMPLFNSDTNAWRQQVGLFNRFGIHILQCGHPRRGLSHSLPRDLSLHKLMLEISSLVVMTAKPNSNEASLKVENKSKLAKLEDDFKKINTKKDHFANLLDSGLDAEVEFFYAQAEAFVQFSVDIVGKANPVDESNLRVLAAYQSYLKSFKNRLITAALIYELKCLKEDHRRPLKLDNKLAVRDTLINYNPGKLISEFHFTLGPKPKIPIGKTLTFQLPDPLKIEVSRWARNFVAAVNSKKAPNFGDLVIYADRSSGRATVLKYFMHQIMDAKTQHGRVFGNALIINLSFALEFDSALCLVFQFLWANLSKDCGQRYPEKERFQHIELMLSRIYPRQTVKQKPVVLVFIGLERLLDGYGQPISADLERLLHLLFSRHETIPLKVVFTTTQEGRDLIGSRFFKSIPAPKEQLVDVTFQSRGEIGFIASLNSALRRCGLLTETGKDIESVLKGFVIETLGAQSESKLKVLRRNWPNYLRGLYKEYGKAEDAEYKKKFIDCFPSSRRKQLKNIVLHQPLDREIALWAQLDLVLMKLLALIGAPVEIPALLRDRTVASLLIPLLSKSEKGLEQELEAKQIVVGGLARLREAGIAAEIAPSKSDSKNGSETKKESRYAMNRVALKDVRSELGIPLGDALLSNTFSLSLEASLPGDLIVPKADVRAEIKDLFSRLRGPWKDVELDDKITKDLNQLRIIFIQDGSISEIHADVIDAVRKVRLLWRFFAMTSPVVGPCLRAATNVLRSFFSLSILLTAPSSIKALQNSSRQNFDDQLRSIDELLDSVEEVSNLESRFDRAIGDVEKCLQDLVKNSLINGINKEENQALIKRLKTSFVREVKNRQFDPPIYGSELTWMYNESATTCLIQGNLYAARARQRKALELNKTYKGEEGNNRNRLSLNRAFLLIERGELVESKKLLLDTQKKILKVGSASPETPHQKPKAGISYTREAELLVPCVNAYLGLVAHLNGKTSEAKQFYEESQSGLQATDQRRALALVHMRLASLKNMSGDVQGALREVETAVREAEAACQPDVVWRSRILQETIKLKLGGDRSDAFKVGKLAYDYGEVCALHRVSVEALMIQTEASRLAENFDQAASYAAKAMTLASRYGMTLRRIALRGIMGEILLNQGDRGGALLLERTINHADRINYQTVVQWAEEKLLKNKVTLAIAR
jgi:tetratricopeptide (TPR) repeat protein